MNTSVLILGAGVSGLTAAKCLQDHGVHVNIVEKSRGVGGRVATRWAGDRDRITGRWDHGAQFATFRNAQLIALLKNWKAWDLMDPWMPSHLDPKLFRTRPLLGMNAFAKALAQDLTIHHSQRIQHLEKTERGWCATSDTAKTFVADYLISTIPLPQFLELAYGSNLSLTDSEAQTLAQVTYDPCLTLLAQTEGPTGLLGNGLIRIKSGILETVIDQYQKGISTSHTLVAHCKASFSSEWYNRNRLTAASLIRASLQAEVPAPITQVQIHGWKFATPKNRITQPSMTLNNGTLLAGDGFSAGEAQCSQNLPPRIESAMLSGQDAAQKLINTIS
ncbi:FAD-dependent oxidoreductase [Kiritimatiellota bacterium B12222]|nr:FAD-dependent oxidoreductase [Kiritimatiellota bacterium B12222]